MKNIIVGFWLWLFGDWKAYQKERLRICNECAPDRSTCPACSCFKELKAKVKAERCPIGRWENGGQIRINTPGGIVEVGHDFKEEYFKQSNIQ
jgi:hypothetical protein